MSVTEGAATTAALADEFGQQLQRTVDWLNSMPLDRLERATEVGSLADRSYAASLAMVRDTEAFDGLPERDLPRLRPHGVGAQLAVVGAELSTAALTVNDPVRADLALMTHISALLTLRRN